LLDMFGMDVGPIVFEYFQQIPNQDCDWIEQLLHANCSFILFFLLITFMCECV
jgi:hypothetical protein